VFCKRVNAVPKYGTPTWTDLGATSAQVEAHIGFKMEDISSPIQNPQSARFHWYFPRFFCSAIDDALFEAMFPMLCLRWAELGVKTATTLGKGSIALIKTDHTRPHCHFANKRPTGQEFFLKP
jgi:hypothetical protein